MFTVVSGAEGAWPSSSSRGSPQTPTPSTKCQNCRTKPATRQLFSVRERPQPTRRTSWKLVGNVGN